MPRFKFFSRLKPSHFLFVSLPMLTGRIAPSIFRQRGLSSVVTGFLPLPKRDGWKGWFSASSLLHGKACQPGQVTCFLGILFIQYKHLLCCLLRKWLIAGYLPPSFHPRAGTQVFLASPLLSGNKDWLKPTKLDKPLGSTRRREWGLVIWFLYIWTDRSLRFDRWFMTHVPCIIGTWQDFLKPSEWGKWRELVPECSFIAQEWEIDINIDNKHCIPLTMITIVAGTILRD